MKYDWYQTINKLILHHSGEHTKSQIFDECRSGSRIQLWHVCAAVIK